MKTLGNVLWVIFGGFLSAVLWFIAGILCCITVIGIPLGKQCFKFAKLTLFPFGKNIVFGGGTVSLLANIVWLIFIGIPMAIADAVVGIMLCVTIIGIPFGLQHFKFVKLDLMPFGAKVEKKK